MSAFWIDDSDDTDGAAGAAGRSLALASLAVPGAELGNELGEAACGAGFLITRPSLLTFGAPGAVPVAGPESLARSTNRSRAIPYNFRPLGAPESRDYSAGTPRRTSEL